MIKFMIFGISGKVHGHHFMSSSPQVGGRVIIRVSRVGASLSSDVQPAT